MIKKNITLGGVLSKLINTLLCVCLLIGVLSFNNNITINVKADDEYVPFTIEYNSASNGKFGKDNTDEAPVSRKNPNDATINVISNAVAGSGGSADELKGTYTSDKTKAKYSISTINNTSGERIKKNDTEKSKFFFKFVSVTKNRTRSTVTLNTTDNKNKYSYIYFLGASTQYTKNTDPTTITVKVTYSDNTSSSKVVNFYDWNNIYLTPSTSDVEGIGIYSPGASSGNGATTNLVHFSSWESTSKAAGVCGYEYVIPVDSTKTISSITFAGTNLDAGNNDYEAAIFAITGKKATDTESSNIKAYIGNEGYTSISDALKNITSESSNKTIKLNSNITGSDNTGDKSEIDISVEGVTIDTNGYTVSVSLNIKANNVTLTDSKTDNKGSFTSIITIDSGKSGTYFNGADLTGEGGIELNNNIISFAEGTYSFNPKTYTSDVAYSVSEPDANGKYTLSKTTSIEVSDKEKLKKALSSSVITDIKVIGSISDLSESINVASPAKTLDLNGQAIITNSSIVVSDNTGLIIKDGSSGSSGSITGSGSEDVIKVTGGNLNIESGTIKATGDSNKCINVESSANASTSVSISGGNFSAKGSNEIVNNSSNAQASITGGNFTHGFTTDGSNNTNKSSLINSGYGSVNTESGDYPYKIVSKDDASAVNAIIENETYKVLLAKDTDSVSSSDLDTYTAIVTAYNSLTDNQKSLIPQATKTKIENAKIAVDFKSTYSGENKILTKTTVTKDDLDDINTALTAYGTDITNDLAKKLLTSIKTDLDNKYEVANFLKTNTYTEDNKSGVIDKTPITASDLSKLTSVLSDYEKLISVEAKKALIGDSADTIKTNLGYQKEAAQFLTTYSSLANIDISKLEGDTKTINELKEAYKTLSDGAKTYIDSDTLLLFSDPEKAIENYKKSLAEAKSSANDAIDEAVTNEKAKIDSQLSDEEKSAYEAYIDYKAKLAKKAVEASKSLNEVDTNKTKWVNDISSTVSATSIEKAKAIASVINKGDTNKSIVEKMNGLDSESKKEAQTDKLDDTVDKAIEEINKASTSEDITSITNKAKATLDDELKEARKEAREAGTGADKNGNVKNVTEDKTSDKPNANDANIVSSSDLEDLLPESDKEEIDQGIDVSLWITVEDTTSSINEDDTNTIETETKKKLDLASNQSIKFTTYLDIELHKEVNGESSTVTSTESELTISLKLDKKDINTDSNYTRVYKIVRLHDNEVTVLDTSFDGKDTITFKSDKFSTYALIYIDTKIENKSNNTSNKTSGTCEETKGKNWMWSEKTKTCVYKVRNTSTD